MPTVNDPNVFVRRMGAPYGTDPPDHSTIVDYDNIAEAASCSGFSERGVELCCMGDLETLGGYRFEFCAGVPKRAGNHFVPVVPNEPDVMVCANTSVDYVRINGKVFVDRDEIESGIGSDEIHNGYHLSDIGNIPIVPKIEVVESVLDDPGVRCIDICGEDCTSPIEYNNIAKAADGRHLSENSIRMYCEDHLKSIGGYRFEYIADEPPELDEPVVTVCPTTEVRQLSIDGYVYANVADMYDKGYSSAYGFWWSDIGEKTHEPVAPGVRAEMRAMLDGPDDPISMIESMKGRKVREVATSRVYADCFQTARCIGCEPWRVHAACTHNLPCTNGYLYEWFDGEDDSDDCPDFEADFGL